MRGETQTGTIPVIPTGGPGAGHDGAPTARVPKEWILPMCGRFNVETSPLSRWLLEVLGVGHPGPDNHNAAPTEQIAVVRAGLLGDPETVRMRWWLTPHWSRELSTRYSMFNARRETLETSPAFREPFRRHRCLVPVSGFYEWTGKAPAKVPWYLRPRAEPGLLLAGIWDRWVDPAGRETIESFAVVTTDAHPDLRFVHSRQPVMLGLDGAKRWLDPAIDPAELRELLEPALPVELDAVPVSSHVNNARHKDRRCIEPIAAPVPVGADHAADPEREP
jgi:putative SOS response-associated peptidase YedK